MNKTNVVLIYLLVFLFFIFGERAKGFENLTSAEVRWQATII